MVRLVEVADPSPPAHDEVLISIRRRIIHPADYQAIRGILPAHIFGNSGIPGSDGMGIVELVGPDVAPSSGITPGTRVIFFPVQGSWAEHVIASAAAVVPVPDDIEDNVACQLYANGITALALLRAATRADDSAGIASPLMVSAAGSSVGRNIIALARMRGQRVVALVRRQARGLSSNGTENLHKGLQASSIPVAPGSRSGLNSPRATMSGMVKA